MDVRAQGKKEEEEKRRRRIKLAPTRFTVKGQGNLGYGSVRLVVVSSIWGLTITAINLLCLPKARRLVLHSYCSVKACYCLLPSHTFNALF